MINVKKCGTSLSPTELINPKSALSGAKPELRNTTNWFLPLDKLSDDLRTFLESRENWKPNVIGQCMSWLNAGDGLQPRAMTRDLNWGVPVPIEGAEGKVMYVWFDAPIGYISATQELLPNDWEQYWKAVCGNRTLYRKRQHRIPLHHLPGHAATLATMRYQSGSQRTNSSTLRPQVEYFEKLGSLVAEFLQDFPGQQDVLRYVHHCHDA